MREKRDDEKHQDKKKIKKGNKGSDKIKAKTAKKKNHTKYLKVVDVTGEAQKIREKNSRENKNIQDKASDRFKGIL